MARPSSVEDYLFSLNHARKGEVLRLREIVLASTPGLTEQVKWNAPSFCWNGEDRVTMRLHPGNRVQLVFHRGAKARDTEGFAFADPSGLIEWAAPDRGTLTITEAAMLEARAGDIAALVRAWIAVTG